MVIRRQNLAAVYLVLSTKVYSVVVVVEIAAVAAKQMVAVEAVLMVKQPLQVDNKIGV